MKEQPLVSVIIPVFNREKYIRESVESILTQTYTHFELIIVDDASTDETFKIVSEFDDPRIRLYKNSINKGVAAALNRGIKEARGELIARADSDDVSIKDRLECQVEYFFSNPEVAICGGGMRSLDGKEEFFYKPSYEEILVELLFKSPLASPTIMIRNEVFNELQFKEELRFSEDYDFWVRSLFDFKAYNLSKILVLYRRHVDQLTVKHHYQQVKFDLDLKIALVKKLGYDEVKFPEPMVRKFLARGIKFSYEELKCFFNWTAHLKKVNSRNRIFSTREFNNAVSVWRLGRITKIYFGGFSTTNRLERIKLLIYFSIRELRYVFSKRTLK